MTGPGSDQVNTPPTANYAHMDSLEKARAAVDAGTLIALLMLPEEFGGDHRPENVVYVPPFVYELKERIDMQEFVPLVEKGEVSEYGVKPTYAGRCLVPTDLLITATTPSAHVWSIAIWRPAP